MPFTEKQDYRHRKPTNIMSKLRKQVCLFGTSANPPTGKGGHVGIVQALSSLQKFDDIRVLPVYQHPFSTKRRQLVSFEHRMAMCQLAFGNISNVTVSDVEKVTFHRMAEGRYVLASFPGVFSS